MLLLLAACATIEKIKAPVQPEITPDVTVNVAEEIVDTDNPNEIIDQASQVFIDPVVDTPTPLIWERLISGFQFEPCASGSVAAEWHDWYSRNDAYMQRVWVRASPWLYDITNEIEQRKLPLEFALLPIVESAYDVFAHSHAGAVGSWQFTAPTAKDYALPINEFYDGRRDMYAATRAALNLLDAHMKRYEQNWRLALAAYNSGPGRVNRAMKRSGLNNQEARPENMRLPLETRTFAPKLHGLACLLNNTPIENLPKIIDQPAIVALPIEKPIDLAVAALLADVSIEILYTLNAGFNNSSTPPKGPHRLLLPVDKADQFENALKEVDLSTFQGTQSLTVQSGDTLSRLAKRHNTNVTQLRAINNLSSDLIRPGQQLLTQKSEWMGLPDYAQTRQELDKLQAGLIPFANGRHKIRPGENLGSIAQLYGVSVTEIQRWNGISNPNRIRAGQTLLLNTSRSVAPQQFAKNYRVQPGDSLWRIAQRNKVTVNKLRNWNGLANNAILQPGQILRLQQ